MGYNLIYNGMEYNAISIMIFEMSRVILIFETIDILPIGK